MVTALILFGILVLVLFFIYTITILSKNSNVATEEVDDERAKYILDNTHKLARIGVWDYDVINDKYTINKMTADILRVPENFTSNHEESVFFYKEGASRNRFLKAKKAAIEFGIGFDIKVEMTTGEGNSIWVRKIAQPEFKNGKCISVFGIFQDISKITRTENKLKVVNNELSALLNSFEFIVIFAGNDGYIKYFNKKAEELLGYDAAEVVDLKNPNYFHLPEELQNFKIDLAKKYNKNSDNFNPFLELARQNHSDTRKWTYTRRDGTTFPVELTLSCIKNNNDENIGFLGVATDLSVKKKQLA